MSNLKSNIMSDSVKGTYENPYSFKEYEDLVNAGMWKGGWVRYQTGVYYAALGGVAHGSLGCDDDGSDTMGSDSIGCDYYGSDDFGSDTIDINPPGQPGDSTGTNPGRGGGGGTGGVNPGGGIPSGGGSGTSHSGGDEYPDIPDVLSSNKFEGYRESDPKGCLNRCKDMLANAGCQLSNAEKAEDREILMANSDSAGNATTAASSFEEGLDYLDSQLKQGNPVIVGVDYGPGHTTGSAWNDKATNHFVIIVGGGRTSGYHFYDPGTRYQGSGTSTKNKFTIDDGILMSTETHVGGAKYYKLVSIRKNK